MQANDKKQARFVGENAFEKITRLLLEFNEKSVKVGYVDLILEKTGGGSIVLTRDFLQESETIFNYKTQQELISFFEADGAGQILLGVKSAE